MQKMIDKAAVLIEALPYFQQFRNAIVVIKFGGSVMEYPELTKNTMRDIVFMECIGMKPVVVHGGGKAISTRLSEMKIQTEFVNGLRYTCDKTLEVVDDVLHNQVNADLLTSIETAGGKGLQISGKDIIQAEKMRTKCPETGHDVDYGFVGKITKVDPGPICNALENDILPIVTPMGKNPETDQKYNINADSIACEIAETLHARKLVFLSDVPGIMRDPEDSDTLISTIKTDEVDSLIAHKIINGGMIPKVNSALHAIKAGTNKVHMIDGRIKHSLLLEIFTDSGVGTQIVAS